MNEYTDLSKKERKQLKKEQEKIHFEKSSKHRSFSKIITILFISILIIGGFYWIFKSANSPKPGQEIADLGREHVPTETEVKYNSNPPTSGSHDISWEKSGIYQDPLEDRKLVHSLEHGYIIISYNCSYNTASDPKDSTPSAKTENDTECKNLVSELTKVAKNQGLKKLIVVPRPSLDDRIALTAWTKLDKFTVFDEKRINTFIQAYWDQGPEKTME